MASCGITEQNEGTTCTVSFTLTEDVDEELMVYYELTNFYQNHRRYVGSRSPRQLMGYLVDDDDLSLECDPLWKNGSYVLNPCGLIANSYFNDVISCTTQNMDETDISWASDRDKKFKQPTQPNGGFQKQEKDGSCPEGWSEADDSSGTAYCYWYPNNDNVQYLYETYPQISPLDGVEDEHFIVWMRTAGLPNFRKLYGKIEGTGLVKGTVITFDIVQNFDVSSFEGTKSIVISTVGPFGGKNPYLGIAYIVVGSISIFFGCLFAIKYHFFPREENHLSNLLRKDN